jgi:MFS family permease
MEEKVEKLFTAAGNANKLQYITLALTFFLWISIEIIPISLPYLEKNPLVTYTNKTSGELVEKVPLNYTICKSGFEYSEAETYNFSWTSELKKECDSIIVALMGSLAFAGFFIGSILFPLITYKLGNKKTIFISSCLFTFVLLMTTVIHSIIFNILALLICQTFCGLIAISTFVNISEITNVKLRSFFGSIINSGYCVCGITYIFLYKLTDSWRINFIISAVGVIIMGCLYMVVTVESPRHYLIKGDLEGFIKELRKLAIKNGRLEALDKELTSPSSELYLENLKPELESINTEKTSSTAKPKLSMFKLFTHSPINKYFFISCIIWFTASGNYYGITINLKNLPGNLYLNGILLYIFEILSYIFASFAINWRLLGRKRTIIFYEVIAVSGYLLLISVNLSDVLTVLIVYFCRFAVAGIFTILCTYSLEVYPTTVRALGFGINSASARVSSIICPFLIEEIGDHMNFIFLVLNALCLVLMFFMPETLNKPLLDVLSDHNEIVENKDSEKLLT